MNCALARSSSRDVINMIPTSVFLIETFTVKVFEGWNDVMRGYAEKFPSRPRFSILRSCHLCFISPEATFPSQALFYLLPFLFLSSFGMFLVYESRMSWPSRGA